MTSRDPEKSGAADLVEVRMMVPRSSLTTVVACEIVTQHNCLAVVGKGRRLFLEDLRRKDFPLPVIVDGKTRGVDRADYVEWLKSRVPQRSPGALSEPELDDVDRALIEAGGRPS